MTYQLFHGDCAEVMAKHIADESIDLTVTSPPYDNLRIYNGFTFDFESIAKQLYRVTKPGGVVVWVVGDQTIDGSETGTSFRQALGFMGYGFKLHDTMIYFKNSVTFPDTNRYFPSFEYMFVLSRGAPSSVNLLKDRRNRWGGTTTFGKKTERNRDGTLKEKKITFIPEYGIRFNVWTIVSGKGNSTDDAVAFNHPAIFPEALARDHILSWSNPGDMILDPFVGSGTTGKMAIANDRNFIGIDVSSEYLAIAEERISKATYQPSLFTPQHETQHETVSMFGD